MKFDYDIGTFF